MAICPPDRTCATPTRPKPRHRPAGLGTRDKHPSTGARHTKPGASGRLLGLNSGVSTGPAEEGLETTQSRKLCQAKLLGAGVLTAQCCKQSFQEKKTNPFWAEKCLEYKSCTWLSPLPSPRPKMISGESRTAQCVCTDKQTLLHQGTDSRSPLVSGMCTGQKGQGWHSHSCAESLLLNRPPVPKDPLIHHPSALKFIQMILFIIN